MFYFLITVSGYLYGLATIPHPEEKIHFIEYGILAYLVFRRCGSIMARGGLRRGFDDGAGLGDEGIQHLLPNRYYQTSDIVLNAVSGLLGLLLVYTFQRTEVNALKRINGSGESTFAPGFAIVVNTNPSFADTLTSVGIDPVTTVGLVGFAILSPSEFRCRHFFLSLFRKSDARRIIWFKRRKNRTPLKGYVNKRLSKDFASFDGKIWLNAASEGPLPLAADKTLRQAVTWKMKPYLLDMGKFVTTVTGLKALHWPAFGR